uniref:Uncharacterized protein n=1 Tax=Oncorhynchus kisutch TaxID=8019 RepID=A0A8C7G6A5_ONCKI
MELDRRLLVAHCATHTPCQSCSGRRIEPKLLGTGIIYLQGRHDKLASWCNTVTDDNTRTYSCAESQSVPMYLDVETSSFYTELPLAEVVLSKSLKLFGFKYTKVSKVNVIPLLSNPDITIFLHHLQTKHLCLVSPRQQG